MFNNAGITWAADTELLTLQHWNSIIDVNIRGVVHGVAAAYPQMVRQGHGFIVNTASMAGLAAAGQITSYVMSKHAIVGLSLALRSEAAAHGIGVLAICPAAVETPILDKGLITGINGREFYRMGQRSKEFYDPDRLARDTLRAIERNKAILVAPRMAYAGWLMARFAPGLMNRMSIKFVARQRAAQGAVVGRTNTMTVPVSIPRYPDDVTADWLAGGAGSRWPVTEVESTCRGHRRRDRADRCDLPGRGRLRGQSGRAARRPSSSSCPPPTTPCAIA